MADLPESNEWTTGIYQLETSDPVLGGPEGIDNLQAKQLANRTRWLKDKTESLGVSLAGKAGKATTLGGYGITDAFTKPEATLVIQQAIASLVASSPAALDTLKELADALGNDPNFATTMTNALAGKAGKATTLGGYGITDAFTQSEATSAIQQAIANLVASSPAALDTLKELADALGNDPNFATTMTNALAGKAAKATTLSGYGITDGATKVDLTTAVSKLLSSSGGALSGPLTLSNGTNDSPELAWATPSCAAYFDLVGNVLRIFASTGGGTVFPLQLDIGAKTAYFFQNLVWHAGNFDPATKADVATLPKGIGVGQTWQDVTATRARDVTYTNTTGRSIAVSVWPSNNARNVVQLVVDGVEVSRSTINDASLGAIGTVSAIIPPGSSYMVTSTTASYIGKWSELR